jgi:hypothetical protein
MNTLYPAVRSRILVGDVLAYWGPPPSLKQPNPVSGLIEFVTEGGPSHVQFCRQSIHLDTPDVLVCESTIEPGKNGIQTNPLGKRLADYAPGSRAEWYALKPDARARLDLELLYEICGAHDGIDHYDVGALFRFLLPTWIAQRFEAKSPDSMVCSVWVALALEYAHVTYGVTAWKQTPADIIALPIFQPPVRIL